MQTILSIKDWWGTQTALNARVPASSVWLGVADDLAVRPYVVIDQQSQTYGLTFTHAFLSYTKFTLTAYDTRLSVVDDITTELIHALKFATVTAEGLGVQQEGQIEKAETPGGYSATTAWTLWEAFGGV